jgi:hypothetical protein
VTVAIVDEHARNPHDEKAPYALVRGWQAWVIAIVTILISLWVGYGTCFPMGTGN